MALQSAHLVFEDDTGVLQSVELSAVTLESVVISSEAASQPLEDASVVSDHIVPNPDTITITGIISNQPIQPNETNRGEFQTVEFEPPDTSFPFLPTPGGIVSAFKNALKSAIIPKSKISIDVLQFPEEFDLIRDFYETLRFLRDTRQPVKVITNLHEYPIAAIIEASIQRGGVGEAVEVNLTIQELRIVSTEIIEAKPVKSRSKKKKSKGQKTTAKPADASILFKAAKSIGLF